jgi:hypothetical protein
MNKNFILKLKVLFIIYFVIISPCFAQLKEESFSSQQLKFISDLYKGKRYFDCISETQRLLNYKKDLADQSDFLYFINACYFFGKQYKTLILRLESVSNFKKDRLYPANLFLLSNSFLQLGHRDKTAALLNAIDYSGIDKNYQDDLFLNRAEYLISAYKYKDILSEIEHAGSYFTAINNSFTLLDFRNDIEHYREIGFKSKWLSAGMSAIVPGTGQMYSGRIMDGIISLISVAGTAYGAYYFYNKKEKPLAVTLTFFSGLFYSGNVYGAYNSAVNKNNELNKQFSGRIIQKYNLKYDPMEFSGIGIIK